MHFSLATILLVSGLVAAAPAPMERVIIVIDDKENHSPQRTIDPKNNYEICWRVCFPRRPECPNGWVSFECFGYFYTTNSLSLGNNLANAGHAASRTMIEKVLNR